MKNEICLDGKKICNDIKEKLKEVNVKNKKKKSGCPAVSIEGLCGAAGVSIYTFRSWRLGRNPSIAKLKDLYAVLDKLEAGEPLPIKVVQPAPDEQEDYADTGA
ncbi:MAG: hypothetical protein WC100_01750 [Sterolibacterium sp.]